MAGPALIEGRTGTLPDGTRVIVRGGKLTTLDDTGAPVVAPVMQDTAPDQKYIVDQRDKAQQYVDAAGKALEFGKLNETQGTGGYLAIPFVPGMVASGNEKVARMTSITSELGPKKRPPGSGSSSDKDTGLYLKSVPNVDFPGNANVAIARGIQADSNRQAAYSAFLERWMQLKGSLLGADPAFSKWWTTQGEARFGKAAMMRGGQPRSSAAANAPRKNKIPTYNPKTGDFE